jgi:hypothetical protein
LLSLKGPTTNYDSKWATGTEAVSSNPGTKYSPPPIIKFTPLKQNPVKLFMFMNDSTPDAPTNGNINVLLWSSLFQLILPLSPVNLNKDFLSLTT